MIPLKITAIYKNILMSSKFKGRYYRNMTVPTPGYRYRTKLRKCAHWLLGILSVDFAIGHMATVRNFYPMGIDSLYEKYNKKYQLDLMLDAAFLLESNGHLAHGMLKVTNIQSAISASPEGSQAYKGEFYLDLIREDTLRRKEYVIKTVFPIISLAVSLLALAVALCGYFYPRKA
jgi:hypothetical protein